MQASLYVLTLGAVVAGWLLRVGPPPADPDPIDLVVVPDLVRPDPALFARATLALEIAAWSIAALAALHLAGALMHHAVDRDDVLARMLPRCPKGDR